MEGKLFEATLNQIGVFDTILIQLGLQKLKRRTLGQRSAANSAGEEGCDSMRNACS